MSLKFPLQTVLDYNNTTEVAQFGSTSVSGGVAKQFVLPQDTDNVVVKYQTSTVGGGASAVFQTTDDGGTTWWDVARTSIVSNANGVTSEWMSISTIDAGGSPVVASVVATGSVQSSGGGIGSAGASTLGQKSFSGLPLLSATNRIFLRYGVAISSVKSERVTVMVNQQSKV